MKHTNQYLKKQLYPLLLSGLLCFLLHTKSNASETSLFPANQATNVNPDTHLEITFENAPVVGTSGQIRIYDAATDRLVDLLDVSIPAGPTTRDTSKNAIYTPVPYEYVQGRFTNANTKPGTPSGMALPTSDKYQLTIIGNFTDGFHFYPIIVHGNTATIYPHNNLLEYGKSYYVQVDPGVLSVDGTPFKGTDGKKGWTFTTKTTAPSPNAEKYTVGTDGTCDFNTVQGAIDFVPDNNPKRVTIFIKNGDYEEIVYFRSKNNITLMGESNEGVVVHYANNEVFNPHPANIKTNEYPGTFPSRRAAFAVDHCTGVHLVNMTIKTTLRGQAEGLLINGEEIIVSHVTVVGSGDALQANGTICFDNCHIIGGGDTVLGRGATFFSHCNLESDGTFMWVRNTNASHGNVFVNCTFKRTGNGETEIARAPTNNGSNYPYCEAVLINCALEGISPVGWGPIGGDASNVHYWEYNSTNLSDGKPVDVSQRLAASRQLTMEKDSTTIANYQNPAFVLGGWAPDKKFLKQYEQLK